MFLLPDFQRMDFASTRRYRSNLKFRVVSPLFDALVYRRRGFCTYIDWIARAPRITASALRIYWVHFPHTRDSARQVRILMREREGVEKRERKYRLCVPVNVDLREGGWEFGGPYINQFHYHRDRGMLGFPLRATSRDSELRVGVWIRFVWFRSRNFSLGDKTKRRGIRNDSGSPSHLQSLSGTLKKSPR